MFAAELLTQNPQEGFMRRKDKIMYAASILGCAGVACITGVAVDNGDPLKYWFPIIFGTVAAAFVLIWAYELGVAAGIRQRENHLQNGLPPQPTPEPQSLTREAMLDLLLKSRP